MGMSNLLVLELVHLKRPGARERQQDAGILWQMSCKGTQKTGLDGPLWPQPAGCSLCSQPGADPKEDDKNG